MFQRSHLLSLEFCQCHILFFDPLKFVAPVLVEAKLLLRELGELDWDELISDEQMSVGSNG